MWYLTSQSDERIIYVTPLRNEIIIGRSSEIGVCNFPITSDASISRKHALLITTDSGLFVQDYGSTYGTFVNDLSNKIQPNSQIQLKNNDVLRFGKLNNVWKVTEKQLITCTSTLKVENMQVLKSVLNKVGALLKNDWDDSCEFLTMPAITLTIKVVLSLVQGSYIVTQDFWDKILEAIENNKPLPEPQNFTPQIIESILNKETVSFLPDNKRQTLFHNKKILFFSKKQFDMYKSVLSNASGEPMLIEDYQVAKSIVCNKDVFVIQCNVINSQDTQSIKNKIDEIVHYLKSNNKRVIAEAEIGLAVLYTSTEKYCNPDFNFSAEVMKTSSQNTKTGKILAQESQEPGIRANNTNVVINESLMSNETSAKRKLSGSDSSLEMNVNKKQATDNKNVVNDNENKRKLSEESDFITSNPLKKLNTKTKTDDDDMFTFLDAEIPKDNQNKEKRLNLIKPQKRKANFESNEDDLFNFLQDDKSDMCGSSKKMMFDTEQVAEQLNIVKIENKKSDLSPQEISAMRGVKLQELLHNNGTYNANVNKGIKKEFDELDNKMKDLDLGTTIVIVNKDLIVKKEPINIETPKCEVKNFKKFKKVWPVKMQVTVISKSPVSRKILQDDDNINSVCYDNIEEQS